MKTNESDESETSDTASAAGGWWEGVWEGVGEVWIGIAVQLALLLLWVLMLSLVVHGIVLPTLGVASTIAARVSAHQELLQTPILAPFSAPSEAMALAVLLLCAMPYPMSFCAALLVQQRAAGRKLYSFQPAAHHTTAEEPWEGALARVHSQFDLEARRSTDGLKRVILHAEFLGCLTSATLCLCALLLNGRLDAPPMTRTAAAITVCTAASASFGVSLARIVVRAAHRDGSGKMFAWATRSLLLSVLGALLLVLLVAQSKDAPFLSTIPGFVGAGITVALFGERFLQSILERAAKMLGMAAPVKDANEADLSQLNGLGEEEMARLAEEGIENVHALAFVPTPRLYFATTFSLQRICNLQDQAMLIVCTQSRAAQFRDQLMIYGAMDAQALAERLLLPELPSSPAPAPKNAESNEKAGAVMVHERGHEVRGFTREELDTLSKLLGFGTLAQARVALCALADDEVTRRLRIYNHGTVRRVDPARSAVRTAPVAVPGLQAARAAAL